MKNTTAILISFLRPGYTKACVESLRRMYPEIKIIVGENGEYNEQINQVCQEAGAKYIQLPFDSGVCVGRNTLLKEVDTKYVLVGDDDFYYDKYAKVDKMVGFLEGHPEYDLIGGRVCVKGKIGDYQGFIEKAEDGFISTPIDLQKQQYEKDQATGIRYCKADLTFNYFVARTDKVREVPWDEEIKVAYEHFSWFYDFKCAGGKVAFSPDPIVTHKPSHVVHNQTAEYAQYRSRRSDKDRFFAKYGIRYIISMNGVKTYNPSDVVEVRKNDTKFTDFCIVTFMRPPALERLLFSIAKYYPMANVYIADQNKIFDKEYYRKLRDDLTKAGLAKRLVAWHVGYDAGVSYSRNFLVNKTPNKYKLILDDDFEFTAETDIGKMIKIMEADPNAGIVGGKVNQLGNDINFEFEIELGKDGTIAQVPDKKNWRSIDGARFHRTGCVLNFALMKKEIFPHVAWDNDLKIMEHLDFYIRMKKMPYNIYYTPDVVISHPPIKREANYKAMRQRMEFMAAMIKKHRMQRIKYLNGQVVELLPDGSLKRFKENPGK